MCKINNNLHNTCQLLPFSDKSSQVIPYKQPKGLWKPSLDKVRNNWAFFDSDPSEILAANHKFSRKISYKSKEAKNIRIQIRAFFRTELGINLPLKYKTFKANQSALLEGYEELEELAKATYKIYPPIAVYAKINSDLEKSVQIISCRYSRHRLDPVWLYRKSQLTRKLWRNYLLVTQVHRNYRPCHLTLTVPHKGGEWKGKTFYARQLIEAFNSLRKRKGFKDSIHGGEYGLEISQTGNNGLHIHIHSLCFVDYSENLKELREVLKKAWRRVCGVGKGEPIFLHLETVYYYSEEKEQYEKLVGVQELEGEDGFLYKPITAIGERKKKVYVTKESSDEDYLKGVLECIKYHFKPSDLYVKNEEGKVVTNGGGYPVVNMELVSAILTNTKGLRMYAKFGFCYGEELLDYKKIEGQDSDLIDIDDDVEMGDSSAGEANIINPETGKKAEKGEYTLFVGMPEFVRHNSTTALFDAGKPLFSSDSLLEISQKLEIKEVMQNLIKCEFESQDDVLRDILDFDGYQRYEKNGRKFNDGFTEFELSELYRY